MSRDIKYGSGRTLQSLKQALQNDEALFLELKELTNDGTDTIGVFEQTAQELPELRLALDPTGTQPPGNGEKLVCRGEVLIQGHEQKVAAFRANG